MFNRISRLVIVELIDIKKDEIYCSSVEYFRSFVPYIHLAVASPTSCSDSDESPAGYYKAAKALIKFIFLCHKFAMKEFHEDKETLTKIDRCILRGIIMYTMLANKVLFDDGSPDHKDFYRVADALTSFLVDTNGRFTLQSTLQFIESLSPTPIESFPSLSSLVPPTPPSVAAARARILTSFWGDAAPRHPRAAIDALPVSAMEAKPEVAAPLPSEALQGIPPEVLKGHYLS